MGVGWFDGLMNSSFGFLRILFVVLSSGQMLMAQSAGIDAGLLSKANSGDAAAQVALGEKYAAGIDVTQDLKEAFGWYRKAAEQGNMAGEIHLAELYRDGRGV